MKYEKNGTTSVPLVGGNAQDARCTKRAKFFAACAFVALCATANAAHISETISLTNGWNAVYLESTPDDTTPDDFFADMPDVLRVGCYESSVYSSTEQILPDGTTNAQKPVAYYVWNRDGVEAEQTLEAVRGGRCYLIYATNTVTKTFYGTPELPHISWQESDSGFTTLAGVSIPAGESVDTYKYFGEGPLGAAKAKVPYFVYGDDIDEPQFAAIMPFRGTPDVDGGVAYQFECEGVEEWPGVVRVGVPNMSGALEFSGEGCLQTLKVDNAGTTNRTIRVAYGPSELASETQPALQVYIPKDGTNAAHWAEFSTHDFKLGVGESASLVLTLDNTKLTEGGTFAALVTVSDLDGGTKMRVRVPVKAERVAESDTNAKFPKGLWYGNVALSQVDRLSDAAPAEAGGTMKLNMMVFVDGEGAAHLMQRVNVGDRRVSVMFPDVATCSVTATAGSFGDALLQFDWVVDENARDNPFRHAWHPDHRTGFAVTNRLALSWQTESGESTFAYNPDEVSYGIATWILGGLLGTGDVTMRGTFALKRILPVSKIEE